MSQKVKPVKITNKIPAVIADGHGIGINPENGFANLIFIQISPNQDTDAPEADGIAVSSIRLHVKQLEQLNKDITKAIEGYKPKKSDE